MEYARGSHEIPRFSVVAQADTPKHSRITMHRLLVDNRDRPAGAHPFQFVVNLADAGMSGFENVLSVEMRALAFPKIENEQYVVCEIDELEDRDLLNSTAPGLKNKAFAICYFDSSTNAPGFIKPARGRDFAEQTVVFAPPKRRLDKLSITFRTHSGAVVQPAQTGNVDAFSMLLEIATTGASQL